MLAWSHDRFEILRPLGAGGMGAVYEAFDRVRRERVALKTIRRSDGEAIYRMKREFRALADLEHPNLVRLYDLFVEGTRCFFTMELVDGVDLETYVAGQPFDAERLEPAVSGLVAGIDALHTAGLLHRDLKPSNVMVTAQGRVVVLDFGLVTDAHATERLTQAGAMSGTAAYMSPEQARGETELTTAVDLYALGVILFQLLTGQLPYAGTALAIIVAKQRPDAPSPRAVNPAVPEALDALVTQLMAFDPVTRADLHAVRVAFGAPTSVHPSRSSHDRLVARTLFGRERELAALEQAQQHAHAGRPALVLVRGQSGIGKSALLRAFVRGLERSGAVVLAGRCYRAESVPFKGLDGTIDALSRVLVMMPAELREQVLPPDLADLGALFPVLRRVKPIGAAYNRRRLEPDTPQRARQLGFACLRELLRRLAAATPLVLVVDDVQWADDDSARGLVQLLRGDDAPGLTVVFGARPDDDAPVLRELFGDEVGEGLGHLLRTMVDLGPLPEEAIRELAGRRLGADSELLEVIAREAKGSPFAAEELARFLQEAERDGVPVEDVGSIDAVVQRRALQLDPTAREVLEVIAVAGEPVLGLTVLQALSLAEDDRAPIDLLRGRGFVRTLRADTAVSVATAHDRIREAVMGGMSDAQRAQRHHQLALALEGVETPPHERLARHFAAAGERRLARDHAVIAATQARDAFACERAAELYALTLSLTDDDRTGELRCAYATALAEAGRHAAAAEAWLAAADLAEGAAARERRRHAAECWLYAGRIDEGLALLAEIASEMGVTIPETRWRSLWGIVVGQLQLAMRGLSFRLRERAELRQTELDRVQTLGAIATQYLPLDPFRGLVPSVRYLLAALDLGDAEELAPALAQQVITRSLFARNRSAERVVNGLDELAAQSGSAKVRVWTEHARGWWSLHEGWRERALACGAAALEHAAALPATPDWLISNIHYVRSYSLIWEIRPEPFEQVAAFIAERDERNGPFAEMRLRATALQHQALLLGQPESVLAFSDDPRWARMTHRNTAVQQTARTLAVHAELYLGNVAAAATEADEVWAACRRQGVHRASFVRCGVPWVMAATALAQGNATRVRAARARFRKPRNGLEEVYQPLFDGAVAWAEGDRGACRAAFTELRTRCETRGFPNYEANACRALGLLDTGPEGDEPRARYLALLEGTGIVDPDLYFWAFLPMGEQPARTGSTRSAWSAADPDPTSVADVVQAKRSGHGPGVGDGSPK
ncbi:MAG: protein kinase [Polyangiales bacterium]